MNDQEQEFLDGLAAELASDTANRVLDRQLVRARQWVAQRQAAGEPATLQALIQKVAEEPNRRSHIIASNCAALWRLMELEGDRDAD